MLAKALTQRLRGDWYGNYGIVSGPGHSNKDRSLKISPHSIDPDDVILHSFAGDDVLTLKREWRLQGLLPSHRTERAQPANIDTKRPAEREKSRTEEVLKGQRTSAWLWDTSWPAARTPVETYLDSRGITAPTANVRYRPARPPRHLWPTMVAAFGIPIEPEPGIITIAGDAVRGVHLTYLRPDGSGKAPVNPAKRMIGRSAGWPIVLTAANDGLGLAIAEGVEDALTIHEATGVGAWAAGAAGRLPGLADKIPQYIEAVTIIADDDPAGQKGATELAHALDERGFEVFMLSAGGLDDVRH